MSYQHQSTAGKKKSTLGSWKLPDRIPENVCTI